MTGGGGRAHRLLTYIYIKNNMILVNKVMWFNF